MKKAFLGVLLTVILLSLGVTSAFAFEPRGGRYFVDANGDGICDNVGTICAYTDADGDGLCDNYASVQSQGGGHGCGFPGVHGNGFHCGRGR